MKKQLRKDGKRINLRDSLEEQDEESVARKQLSHVVKNFMGEEGNSSECPDNDKTNLRYCLDFLSVLPQKFFLAESGHDCSFAEFCRLIPENIIKPKPTDWGTNLCMTCINPQLMLEGLKRAIKERFNGLNLEDICEYSKKDLHELMSKVGELKKNIHTVPDKAREV